MPWNRYPDWPARLAFNERLVKDLARQPGVLAAGVVNNVPLSGNSGKSAATVVGHVRLPGESARGHYSYGVDGDYFAAMGFSLREGRFLTADDSRKSTRVCVVDEDFARYYWPHTSALGHHLFEGSEATTDAQSFTVVGVVGAVKQAGLTDQAAQGAVYYPYALRTDDSLFVVVRTSLRPESFGLALQKIVRQIDVQLPINDLKSMDARIGRQPRGATRAGISCGHLFADRDTPGRGRRLRCLKLRRGAATPRNRFANGIGGRGRARYSASFSHSPYVCC